MRIQIDTKAKTIKIDENVRFDELVRVLNKLLPKQWKEYTLEPNSTIYWYNPVPWTYQQPWIIGGPYYMTYEGGNITTSVYNVEVIDNKTETIIDDHIVKYSDVWKALAQ
jgi:hypothetical protein